MKIRPRSTWMIDELLGVERGDCRRNRTTIHWVRRVQTFVDFLSAECSKSPATKSLIAAIFCKHRRLR